MTGRRGEPGGSLRGQDPSAGSQDGCGVDAAGAAAPCPAVHPPAAPRGRTSGTSTPQWLASMSAALRCGRSGGEGVVVGKVGQEAGRADTQQPASCLQRTPRAQHQPARLAHHHPPPPAPPPTHLQVQERAVGRLAHALAARLQLALGGGGDLAGWWWQRVWGKGGWCVRAGLGRHVPARHCKHSTARRAPAFSQAGKGACGDTSSSAGAPCGAGCRPGRWAGLPPPPPRCPAAPRSWRPGSRPGSVGGAGRGRQTEAVKEGEMQTCRAVQDTGRLLARLPPACKACQQSPPCRRPRAPPPASCTPAAPPPGCGAARPPAGRQTTRACWCSGSCRAGRPRWCPPPCPPAPRAPRPAAAWSGGVGVGGWRAKDCWPCRRSQRGHVTEV